MKIIAAIYCRLSTDEQARKGISPSMQRLKALDLVKERCWSAEVFSDRGYSGKDMNRPFPG